MSYPRKFNRKPTVNKVINQSLSDIDVLYESKYNTEKRLKKLENKLRNVIHEIYSNMERLDEEIDKKVDKSKGNKGNDICSSCYRDGNGILRCYQCKVEISGEEPNETYCDECVDDH